MVLVNLLILQVFYTHQNPFIYTQLKSTTKRHYSSEPALAKRIVLFCLTISLVFSLYAQRNGKGVHDVLNVTVSGTINTDCSGADCFYDGPTIMINEVMLAPNDGDGSIAGSSSSSLTTQGGEWIELYNPHKCLPVDISCYFLGNNAPDMDDWFYFEDYGGGFALPQGTIVPPQGFCVVRGVNAPAVPSNLLVQNGGNVVEVIVNSRYCFGGGYRLWFPNTGGWFAFYDANGVPQDAISWGDNTNSCNSCSPCRPTGTGCGFTGTLPSYNQIPSTRKHHITSSNPEYYSGYSLRRIPDGGNWQSNYTNPTYGLCNTTCVPPPVITCTGTATATVTGGTPPYTYQWDDGTQATTASITGLCAGTYHVTVTDNTGTTAIGQVVIEDFVPEVSHPSATYCLSDSSAILQGLPAGGTYEGAQLNGNTLVFDGVTEVYNMTYTYTDEHNCSGTANFQIHVIPNIFTFDSTICSIDTPMTWYGESLSESGQYEIHVPSGGQCDSIIFFNLTVSPNPTVIIRDTLPEDSLPRLIHGFVFDHNIDTLIIADNGTNCDSLIYYTLYICRNTEAFQDTTICANNLPFRWNGQSLQSEGDYTAHFFTACNSDSILHLSLSIIDTAVRIVPLTDNFCETFTEELTVITNLPDYVWSTGATSTNIIAQDPGLYTVTAWNGSCSNEAQYAIKACDLVMFLPNTITPSKLDGTNDVFSIPERTQYQIGTFEITIFNRWGETVFHSTDKNFRWNGEYKGKLYRNNVYSYLIHCTNTQGKPYQFKGTITVL